MVTKISGTDGIDTNQLRASDGDPVAMTIDSAGVVAFPQTSIGGGGPIFRAVGDVSQTVPNTGTTKLSAGLATFNPDGAWQGSNKFLPNKAGYYFVGMWITLISQAAQYQFIGSIYKNGAPYDSVRVNSFSTTQMNGFIGSLVYLNGTTDYIEFFASHNYTGNSTVPSGSPIVSAYFVRA